MTLEEFAQFIANNNIKSVTAEPHATYSGNPGPDERFMVFKDENGNIIAKVKIS